MDFEGIVNVLLSYKPSPFITTSKIIGLSSEFYKFISITTGFLINVFISIVFYG